MDRPAWAPDGVDMQRASPARMYDALLGGSHNFEIDRAAADAAQRSVPDLPRVALSNRAFLRRAVRFMVGQGIRQFLDIGSGIPTAGNVHEIVQGIDVECRVLYVDLDPVAVAHSRSILGGNERAGAIEADVRKTAELLGRVRETGLIDLEQPVGLLLVAVLHMLSQEEEPTVRVGELRAAVAPGSYVAISHLTSELRPEDADTLGSNAAKRTGVGIHFRDRNAIARMFEGWQSVEPGVVELPQWRPESERDLHEAPGRSLGLAGVGLKA